MYVLHRAKLRRESELKIENGERCKDEWLKTEARKMS